jgi:carboxypeptidase C (cathepsin A)
MADETKEVYPTLIEKAGITVVIYNGEADACVPHTDNEAWTSAMGYTVREPFAAWTASDGSLGGYITKYAPPGNGKFTYLTVRGAGHMVPSTQPLYALDVAKTYILGGEL